MRHLRVSVAALLVGASVALGACQPVPATGQSGFSLISTEEERRMGAEADPEIQAAFGGPYHDARLQAYVAGLGQRLVGVSELAGQPFRFLVLDSPIVNAMALPGGYVYVTRGLVALADDEAELAGVIGHEIGHVTGRHTAQRQSQAIAANVLAGLLGVLSGVPAAGDLAGVGAAAYLQSYSRDQESEADGLGIRYLARAGWDPEAMASFLAKLRAQSQLEAALAGQSPDSVDQSSLWASHPRTHDRVREAAAEARHTAQAGAASLGRGNRDAFLARLDGLSYGGGVTRNAKGKTTTTPAPHRVAVVTVQAGDTVASLAARMPYDDGFAEQRLRVLNGLDDDDRLRPGQRIKTIR